MNTQELGSDKSFIKEGKQMNYKKAELIEHFLDALEDFTIPEVLEMIDDSDGLQMLHNRAFNEDYYIIGTYQAKQWLGDEAFNIIQLIKEYEQDNFGEVFTDLSEPERVVNMYAYILGQQIVYNPSEWRDLWTDRNVKAAIKAA